MICFDQGCDHRNTKLIAKQLGFYKPNQIAEYGYCCKDHINQLSKSKKQNLRGKSEKLCPLHDIFIFYFYSMLQFVVFHLKNVLFLIADSANYIFGVGYIYCHPFQLLQKF